MRGIDLSVELPKKQNFLTESGEIEKLGFEGIVKIRGVVCNFIDPVDELRFEGRAQSEKELGQLRYFRDGTIVPISDEPFTNFEPEIWVRKTDAAVIELYDG